ncbi:hypothetical protein ACWGDT_05345 [Streptomyces avermitilis]
MCKRGRGWLDATPRDLEDYEHWRRKAEGNPSRVGGSKWGRELAASAGAHAPRPPGCRWSAGSRFSNQYPWQWQWQWQWQPAEFEAFIDHLRARTPTFTASSGRNYQYRLRLFCEYITDPRYGWLAVCQERFGQVPVQILHHWPRCSMKPATLWSVPAALDGARCGRPAGNAARGTALRDVWWAEPPSNLRTLPP